MTNRLYYDDCYTAHFSARIIERLQIGNHPAVILDQTYFYPTSGGQPNDTGSISGIPVADVQVRESDGEVLHILAAPLNQDTVEGRIDWNRRFDHMQHHTGQHILTQAFVQTANARTIGFHLSGESVTIDLDRTGITPQEIERAEDLANKVIFENHRVIARLREMDDQEGIRIRRLPRHLMTEGLRVIDIESFDVTACGGTHVAHTGEIGCIKILRLEKRGEKTRVEFRCGERALKDYREKNHIANTLTTLLSCKLSETPDSIEKLREDLKIAQTALKNTTNRLLDQEAAELRARADGNPPVVIAVFENRDPSELRMLASKICNEHNIIALLGSAGEKSGFCFARGESPQQHMGVLLKMTLEELGGRGGGQPNMAQGGGFPATQEQVASALKSALRHLT